MIEKGTVYLVGAGPGDPGLITRRGLEILRKAEVIVYDRLVAQELLWEADSKARLIPVGKSPDDRTISQADINRILADEAAAGRSVCRLKGGDPFVFGRGGEEADYLHARGIQFEIVPGVTSAVAAPAYAGIPITDRRFASSVAVVSGHKAKQENTKEVDWAGLSQSADTLVVLMGRKNLANITNALISGGCNASTPAAIVQWATTGMQRSFLSNLAEVAELADKYNLKAPCVLVVGEVAAISRRLQWFENRPLSGIRIIITRPRLAALEFAALLRALGAQPIVAPLLQTEMLVNAPQQLHRLLQQQWDWVLFTSAQGVLHLKEALQQSGLDWRALSGAKLGAIGPATAKALCRMGLAVDFIPTQTLTVALAEELPAEANKNRVLLPCSTKADTRLEKILQERGMQLERLSLYTNIIDEAGTECFLQVIKSSEAEVITFASPSTVQRAVELAGVKELSKYKVACIGPVTQKSAAEHGLEVEIVATDHTAAGLAAALAENLRLERES